MLSVLLYQFESTSDSKNANDHADRSEPILQARLFTLASFYFVALLPFRCNVIYIFTYTRTYIYMYIYICAEVYLV